MPSVKANLLNIARIATASVFLGIGCFALFTSIQEVVRKGGIELQMLLFLIPFLIIFCGIFFASGLFLLRRSYRSFASIWVVLGAVFIFSLVIGIPRRVRESFDFANTDWRVGLLYVPSLFAGAYAARWFCTATFRLLDRHLPHERHGPVSNFSTQNNQHAQLR